MNACRAAVLAACVLIPANSVMAAQGPADAGGEAGATPSGPVPAVGPKADFDSVEALMRAVPATLMPPGKADAEAVLAFRRWAKETLAGKRLIADVIVDRVSGGEDGKVVLEGHVASPLGVHGLAVRCSVRADFRDSAPAVQALPPGRPVTLVGTLAKADPLYPSRGTVRTASGAVRVAGWSESYAFFGTHLFECSKETLAPPAKPEPEKAKLPPEPVEPPAPKMPDLPPNPVPPEEPEPPAERNAQPVEFFGVREAHATRIVYVVDCSGSMTDSIDFVKSELRRSIASLNPRVRFHICFYSSGPPVEMPTRKLVPATEAAKQRAFDFIGGIVPHGQTDPSVALKRAFEKTPDLIYLLTDGEFDAAIVDLVRSLNAEKKVRVSTIAFLYRTGEVTLKEIAAENWGVYKFVGEKDLPTLGEEEEPKE